MNIFDKKSQKLEQALRESYYDKEQIEVGSRWKTDAMRQIRQAESLNEAATWSFFVTQVGWRFAAAVCTVVLIVAGYAGFSGFNLLEELTSLFFINPVELTVAQIFF